MEGILIEDLTEQTSLAESDNLIVGGSDANKITVANVISALKDLGLLNELGNKIFYATCSTAAATAAKVVTTTEDGFELATGVMIAVYFSTGNSASSVTLNVNNTGAKTMYAAYTSTTDGSSKQYRWMTGDVIIFVYNGTGWRTVNKGMATTTYYGLTKLTDSTSSTSTTTAATPNSVKTAYDLANGKQDALTFDTTPTSGSTNPVTSGGVYDALQDAGGSGGGGSSGNPVWYATCSTAASTTAKAATTTEDGFALTTGASVRILFTYANSASSATLNVNSTGAKSIKMYGTTSAYTYMWQAGCVIDFVYNGTYWVIVDGGYATTTYYGKTKLIDSVTSTSTAVAATPNSVKKAYDLADEASTALENVGAFYYQTVTVTTSTSGEAVYTVGGSITIPAGTYILFAKAVFTSNTTGANRRVQIYDTTNSTIITTEANYGTGYVSIHCSFPYVFTAETTICCRVSNGGSVAISTGATIYAMRIA